MVMSCSRPKRADPHSPTFAERFQICHVVYTFLTSSTRAHAIVDELPSVLNLPRSATRAARPGAELKKLLSGRAAGKGSLRSGGWDMLTN